jgi:hypothetical protein
MRAVWLNRTGAQVPEGVRPDAVISTLEPLPDLVDRLLDDDAENRPDR